LRWRRIDRDLRFHRQDRDRLIGENAPLDQSTNCSTRARSVVAQPRRVVGLAWRRSSPRKLHFVEHGKLITSATSGQMRDSEMVRFEGFAISPRAPRSSDNYTP
jgi:hypothetical protein